MRLSNTHHLAFLRWKTTKRQLIALVTIFVVCLQPLIVQGSQSTVLFPRANEKRDESARLSDAVRVQHRSITPGRMIPRRQHASVPTTGVFQPGSQRSTQAEIPQGVRDYFLPGDLPPQAGRVLELGPPNDSIGSLDQTGSLPPRFPIESTIQYTSFDSRTYTLRSFSGKYVRWAFPESWLGTSGFSPSEVRQLVDLADLLYAHMSEIVAAEPAGDGLLTIAVVEMNFGGLGFVGAKGLEISTAVISEVKSALASGLSSAYVYHEMAHNFDVYHYPVNYLSYYDDFSHAWTSLLHPLAQIYARSGSDELSADTLLNETVTNYLRNWNMAGERASWALCVRNGGGCAPDKITANDAWAGFALRFTRMHGIHALKQAFAFLSDLKSKNSPGPQTPEEKNDLFVRALASGLSVNINCEIETWRWQISTQLSNSNSLSHPGENSLCRDNDGDGFRPTQNDFDDLNAAIRPGALETVNGIDDDCNGYIDDVVFREGIDFNSPSYQDAPTVPLRVRITGQSQGGNWDHFRIDVPSAKRINVRLRSIASFAGWWQRLDPFTTIVFAGAGDTRYGHAFFEQPGKHTLALLQYEGNAGDYEVLISEPSDRSNPVSLRVSPGPNVNTVRVTAMVNPALIGNEQPTSIRFWADGMGFIQSIPFSQNASCELTIPIGLGSVGLRAQLVAQDHPVSSPSDPIFVAWEAVTQSSSQTDIKTWTIAGRTYAYLKLSFPNAGYRVANWGQPTRAGNEFTADAAVEKFTGTSIQAGTSTAQIYDLGPLANGTYNFNFKTSGTLVKSLQFTVSSAAPPPNPIDDARTFVKWQYRDFLNREPDQAGEDFWTDNITKCNDPARRPPGQTVEQCTLRQRETTSGAFFLSPEFQYTAYFVYRMYQGVLGRQPKLSEFVPDAQFVGNGIIVNGQLSAAQINQNKAAFAAQFVNCVDATKYRCAEYKAIYDALTNQQFVDKLFQTTGVNASASDRAALVNGLNGATQTRASVAQKVVDGINVIAEGNQQFTTTYGQAFYNAESNRAFVQLEYFGYMKRDPDEAGYAFWLGKLNQFNGDFVAAEMVLAFISSPEYRARFGQP